MCALRAEARCPSVAPCCSCLVYDSFTRFVTATPEGQPFRDGTVMERSGGNRRRLPATEPSAKRAIVRATASSVDQRQPAPPNCHAGGRGFESRRSRRTNFLQIAISCCLFRRRIPLDYTDNRRRADLGQKATASTDSSRFKAKVGPATKCGLRLQGGGPCRFMLAQEQISRAGRVPDEGTEARTLRRGRRVQHSRCPSSVSPNLRSRWCQPLRHRW